MHKQLLFRKVHRWLGLLLGIQILLWFTSGFLMSFMPIDEIRGDHLLQQNKARPIDVSAIDLTRIEQQLGEPLMAVEIKSWLNQTILLVQTTSGRHRFDRNNQKIKGLDEAQIKQIITTQLKPDLSIASIRRLDEVPAEARGRSAPIWQVQLNGAEQANIYISQQTGEIVAKRTDRWRLFDFMWMLHIMDYDERSDFNHPLLYLTALSALLFTLSGFVLLYFTLIKRKRHKTKAAH
ncbi:PepSY domain-containing protein [Marinicella sp. S1101]|uniref:PepSY domain-containing protein n=1 Tax=Marinicella marina TaxID=2996016 RepID=UPI002260FDC4|nr:PepSY domain-containing protein [Marinicella marina]MCX7553138.1 PepSY domain-containing protein [Marinicella marina]MDJ1138870.1 PepSY domain-containing protein [Marinicella marina]